MWFKYFSFCSVFVIMWFKYVSFCSIFVIMWYCKETEDASVTRPSYAQMAVRGKERLQENNGEMPISGDSPVTEVSPEAACEMLHDKQTARGCVLHKCKKSSPRHSIASRRSSGDCIAKENHCVQSTVCQTERHSTVWYWKLKNSCQSMSTFKQP